ncbi:hypothetical protein ACIP4Y_35400 [Streptomyces sp. NPDC088810]|uniref:hypothetical protein n=1 Tax=Streptomyces sp. NPDC088810 TaxID=3365904 RepID=UPI003829A754
MLAAHACRSGPEGDDVRCRQLELLAQCFVLSGELTEYADECRDALTQAGKLLAPIGNGLLELHDRRAESGFYVGDSASLLDAGVELVAEIRMALGEGVQGPALRSQGRGGTGGRCLDGAGCSYFGHDPSSAAERVGDNVRLTFDADAKDGSRVIELPVGQVRALVTGAEADLRDFHSLAGIWPNNTCRHTPPPSRPP